MANKGEQKMVEFLKKYPERTIMWAKDHEGQDGPPVAVTKSGDLQWINREMRRKLSKEKR